MNYKELYKYVVFKYNVYDDSFLVFAGDECPSTGFSSLYSVTGEVVETLSSAGIAGYKGPVWSEKLAIDLDSDEASIQAERKLRALGIAFEVWSTGNRGRHIYIPRPHAPSHILPALDKEWVKANIPNADLSIYSHLHMFRVPGAIHAKTGNRKVLLTVQEGTPLQLGDNLEIKEGRGVLGSSAVSSIFENHYIMNWTVPWENGKRHEALLHLGLAMRRLGEPIEFIARWLYHTNLLFTPPKPQEELERIIQFVEVADLNGKDL